MPDGTMLHAQGGPLQNTDVVGGRRPADTSNLVEPGAFIKDPLAGFQRAPNAFDDSSIKAFNRGSGASHQRRIEAIKRARDRQFEDIGTGLERGQRDINANFESRGLFRSSAKDTVLGENQSDADLARSRIDEDVQLQMEEIARAKAAAGRAAVRRRQAAIGAALEQRVTDQIRADILPHPDDIARLVAIRTGA